jgi:hypothetical protein
VPLTQRQYRRICFAGRLDCTELQVGEAERSS